MGLRDFNTVPYLPMLAVSVAEMRALEELPERDKSVLLPMFQLRPWGVSATLAKTIDRIEKAYGDRPYIADICEPVPPQGEPREVHGELDRLRSPANGYQNWQRFIADHPNAIPTVQLGDLANLQQQVVGLVNLRRGLAVYIPRPAFGRLGGITNIVASATGGGVDVIIILDLGQRGQDLLVSQAEAVGLIQTTRANAPNAHISVSASSFPSDFVGRTTQQIYERLHFQGVTRALGSRGLVYGDRGSARAEKQMGGGGTPAPRVDLATAEGWSFFRDATDGDRIAGYIRQSQAALGSPAWDRNLRVWGYQMIERAAGHDRNAIKSPASAAAARINIHLHQQTFYGDAAGLYDTDEEWTDD